MRRFHSHIWTRHFHPVTFRIFRISSLISSTTSYVMAMAHGIAVSKKSYHHFLCGNMTNNWLRLYLCAICWCGIAAFAPSFSASKQRTSTSLYGVRSAVRRARDSLLSKDRTDKDLKDGIAFFYDRSSKLWEDVWGEHMHQ